MPSREPGQLMTGGGRGGGGLWKAAAAGLVVGVVVLAGFFYGPQLLSLRPGGNATDTAQEPERTADERAADAGVEAFAEAWEAEDWPALQAATADQGLDAGGTHQAAHAALQVTATTVEPGLVTLDEDRQRARTTADVTWTLAGFDDDVTFTVDLAAARVTKVDAEPSEPGDATGPPQAGGDATAPPQAVPDEAEASLLSATPEASAGPTLWRVDWFFPTLHPDLTADGRFERVREAPQRGPVFAADGTPLAFTDEAGERTSAAPGLAAGLVGAVGEASADDLAALGEPYEQGDQVGRSGLERSLERELAGTPTREARLVDGAGLVATLAFEEGTPPQGVDLAIDPPVQRAVEAALAGAREGTALVAVDPATGHVLGAGNAPATGLNRALSGGYPPGSTFKVVTAAAALAGGRTPGDAVECPARATLGGREIGNAGEFALGTVSLQEAFARSCNTTFGQLGIDAGDQLAETAETFGFGAEYSLGVTTATGSFPAPESDTERAAAAIGQGRVEASPVHMASVIAAAVDGTWRTPQLVLGRETEQRPLPDGVRDALAPMLREVVASGTGTSANAFDDVVGKTGSAEFGTEVPPPTHAWFVGARGPVAFAAFVEAGGAGGAVAGPVAASFLRALDAEGGPTPDDGA